MTTDLPKRWTRTQYIKNTIIYYCIVGLVFIFRFIPLGITARIGALLGWIGFYVAAHERKKSIQQLQQVFADKSRKECAAIAKASFIHLGMSAGEALHADVIARDMDSRVVFHGDSREVWEKAASHSAGTVFCTGHIGNWEVFGYILAAIRGPLYTVARRSYDPRLTKLIDSYRRKGGFQSLWRGEKPLKHVILDVLNAGNFMAFLIDQDMKVPGIFVEFLGKPAHTPMAPASFALSTNATIIIGHIHRQDGKIGHYTVDLQQVPYDPDGDKQKQIHTITQHMSDHLAQAIRKKPQQWVWMHRRWKQKPEDYETK